MGHIFRSTFKKKYWGQLAPKFSFFVARTSISGRQKLYLRINGFSFVTDNRLSLVYVFPKKKVTYLGGQVGEQVWKFGRHWVKAGRIGYPTGRNVEPRPFPITRKILKKCWQKWLKSAQKVLKISK